jgi:uncharacterized membrane protein YdcZ (DUF606 family)
MAVVLVAGISGAVQPKINSVLGARLGSALVASLVVLAGALPVEAIGVAVFSVAFFAGRKTFDLVVDRLGVAPGGKRPVTSARVWARICTPGGQICAQTPDLAVDGRGRNSDVRHRSSAQQPAHGRRRYASLAAIEPAARRAVPSAPSVLNVRAGRCRASSIMSSRSRSSATPACAHSGHASDPGMVLISFT